MKPRPSPADQALKTGRRFLFRVDQGEELLGFVTSFCVRRRIHCGVISIIGACSKAVIGYYDQLSHQYSKKTFEQELEIVSCQGNVSLKEGKPFLHLHAVLSDTSLKCYGGHVFEGMTVFAAEVSITELKGSSRIREADPKTGLFLWPCAVKSL